VRHILKCSACGKYTISTCACGGTAVTPVAPKYSPEDKYADYRRKAKLEEWKAKGLL